MKFEIHNLNVEASEKNDKEWDEFDKELDAFFKKHKIDYLEAMTEDYLEQHPGLKTIHRTVKILTKENV